MVAWSGAGPRTKGHQAPGQRSSLYQSASSGQGRRHLRRLGMQGHILGLGNSNFQTRDSNLWPDMNNKTSGPYRADGTLEGKNLEGAQAGKKVSPSSLKASRRHGELWTSGRNYPRGASQSITLRSLGVLVLLSSPLRCCGTVDKTPKGEVHAWNPSEVAKIWAAEHFPRIMEGQRTRTISWQPRHIEIISATWGGCVSGKTSLKSDSQHHALGRQSSKTRLKCLLPHSHYKTCSSALETLSFYRFLTLNHGQFN